MSHLRSFCNIRHAAQHCRGDNGIKSAIKRCLFVTVHHTQSWLEHQQTTHNKQQSNSGIDSYRHVLDWRAVNSGELLQVQARHFCMQGLVEVRIGLTKVQGRDGLRGQ